MRLRSIVFLNLAGRGTALLIGVLSLPVNLYVFGLEGVAYIGFYNTLFAFLAIIDHVLSPILMRETARAKTVHAGPKEREVVRFFGSLYGGFGLVSTLLVCLASPLISRVFLESPKIDFDTTMRCVLVAGVTVALHLAFNLHIMVLNGLERAPAANALAVAFPALRLAGSASAALAVGYGIEAYFWVQLVVLAGCLASAVHQVRSALPTISADGHRIAPSWRILSGAPALAANAVLFTFITQADKVIVSALFPLDTFGRYVVASTIANLFFAISTPVHVALLPRFSLVAAQDDRETLSHFFHLATQFLSMALLPAAMLALLFPQQILVLWGAKDISSPESQMLLQVLCAGTVLWNLTAVPNVVQLAAGWTHFSLVASLPCLLVVPLAWAASRLIGPLGAAAILPIMAAFQFVVMPLMLHARILPGERARWYLVDIALPALVVLALGLACRTLLPPAATRAEAFFQLVELGLAATAVVVAVLPGLRREIGMLVRRAVGTKFSRR